MDNNNYFNNSIIGNGIPYDNVSWQDVPGNPFGKAGNFNAIIFGDANNIVDMKGAFAVGGSFYSPRGLTLNFGNDPQRPIYYPENIAFLVGNNVSMNGPLVTVGHVAVNGNFRAASGSTFLIGKDGNPDQINELDYLYEASGQSRYWSPTDRGDHYIISSYDTPHYIPPNRIDANVPGFFQDARTSIEEYKECIENIPANGIVEEDFHEWVLIGDDPDLNVFVLDRRPNGLINKGISFRVPNTSTIVVRLQTGSNAHLQYGLLGSEEQASKTLYVFEDATNIYMEVPAAIWGSFLAPDAMLHGHRTGGHITGNVALNAFAVSANSGFEFHLPVFDGQIFCPDVSDVLDEYLERPEPEIPEPFVPEPFVPEPIEEEPCPDCLVEEGIISGCISGCKCCKNHGWEVALYEICGSYKQLIECIEISNYDCFEFYVPYKGHYCLEVYAIEYKKTKSCSYKKTYLCNSKCKAKISMDNIGVSNFYL